MPEPYLARLARYADLLPEEAPDSTLLLVARAAFESGRLDRAEALASRVRASSPQWPAAQRLLADLAVRAGRPHEAARVVRGLTELSGESAYRRQQRDLAWLALGQLYLSWASRQH
ncbi:MAG: tetratricopeptide repeat protein [Sandaracinaceae bacterium]|nr:tetratricopeptide repeat protein [Sandaracinaceae bacterium]